ncbi:CRISPR-associated exonuclease Cas4 [uncultured archaeon]|nr:CRISPR-associated exonuclease Cas4 [uncultured archaeon]
MDGDSIDFDRIIDKYLYREARTKTVGRYYPSEVGQCIRKSWFSFKMPKQIEPNVTKIFEAGNLLHEFVVEVLKSDKTPEVTLIDSELPLKMKIDEFEISGRIDDIIRLEHNGEKLLVEVKSTKSVDFLREPSEQYMMQLQFYMHATGIHKGVILYVEKNTLKSKSFATNYDPKLAETIISRFRELHLSLKNNSVPHPEARQSSKNRWMCQYCAYKKECDEIETGEK